ncbi:MAG: hypothetical protein IBX40_04755, partial [Methanosarcinales archaeon]|nr:hypothetical protein [Methanosarcinales archaeon]
MRKIKKEDIENLVKNAPQKLGGKKNRIIIQGKYPDKDQNKEMLLRYYLIAMRIRTADKRRRAELS